MLSFFEKKDKLQSNPETQGKENLAEMYRDRLKTPDLQDRRFESHFTVSRRRRRINRFLS